MGNDQCVVDPRHVFPLRGSDEHDQIHAVDVPDVRPFGLRYLTTPGSGAPVDFSNWGYDEERQVAVVYDNGVVVPAAKHSTGPTQTPTSKDDAKTKYERDQDHTED